MHHTQHASVVCFAGSRHGAVSRATSSFLVSSFSMRGYRFTVGCAHGIDACFRNALSTEQPLVHATVHCAFPSLVDAVMQTGLPALCCVGTAPSPAAALHRRTVFMVSASTLLVLFPDNPKTGTWGKGSRLAFNTAVQYSIPVFVVTAVPPQASTRYRVVPQTLFGEVSGYRVTERIYA